MHRRLINRYQAVCKEIHVPNKKTDTDINAYVITDVYNEKHLSETENTELDITNSQTENCNYTIVHKIPLQFTVEEMKKGLENSTRCLFKTGEIQKDGKIILTIKIKKRVTM